jgi:large subunit ribosomal protein L1
MSKIGKRMRKALEGINNENNLTLAQAVEAIQSRAKTKFDETVDIAINLNIDTRKADQNIRGMVSLPHGTGKTLRVAVFAKDDKAEEARKAGADLVGAEELVESILKGEINFDRCIATPDMMGLVGRVARVLGPKGLMPNPKLGTVTPNVSQAVQEAKAGQIEYRAEKNGIIHAGVGKVSFGSDKLSENIKFFVNLLVKARPAGVKGSYVKKISLSSTMGPSVRVDLASIVEG